MKRQRKAYCMLKINKSNLTTVSPRLVEWAAMLVSEAEDNPINSF